MKNFLASALLSVFLFVGIGGVGFQAVNSTGHKIEKASSIEKFVSHFTVSEARADDAVPAAEAPADDVEIPSWVAPIVTWLQTVPTVGPILIEVLKWLGIVAAVLTALATLMQALAAAFVGVAKMAGFVEFANKAKAFLDKILAYVKYFSMFNVQKK